MNCIHSAALCCQWRSKCSMYRCDFVYIGILIKSYGYKPMTKAKWNKNPKQVLFIWSFDTAISAGIQMYMKRFEAQTNCIRFDLIYSLAFMPIVCVSFCCVMAPLGKILIKLIRVWWCHLTNEFASLATPLCLLLLFFIPKILIRKPISTAKQIHTQISF